MFAIDLRQEIELETIFDKYIDPDLNGDVDVDEWLLGLEKLDVTLSEQQKRKIFDFMDKDGYEFVEKSDFIQFATTHLDNTELTQLQKIILQTVKNYFADSQETFPFVISRRRLDRI